MIRIDAKKVDDVVVCVRTGENRLDFVKSSAVTSAGFLREKTDSGSRWALVLNYPSPYYTKIIDLSEALAVIGELYGDDGLEQAKAIVGDATGRLVGEVSKCRGMNSC